MRYKFLSQKQKDAMVAYDNACREYSAEQKILYELGETLAPKEMRTPEEAGAWAVQCFAISEAFKRKRETKQIYLSLMYPERAKNKSALEILKGIRTTRQAEILAEEKAHLKEIGKDPKTQAFLAEMKKLLKERENPLALTDDITLDTEPEAPEAP